MTDENLIKHRISQAKLRLKSLAIQLNQALVGDECYVFDSDMGVYERKHMVYKNYLNMPFKQQKQYCQIRELYNQCLYDIAMLYQDAGAIETALSYHLKGILSGNIDRIFQSDSMSKIDAKSITFNRDIFSALSALLGIGQAKNIETAMGYFNNCVKNKHSNHLAHLFLGIIHFFMVLMDILISQKQPTTLNMPIKGTLP